MQGPKCFLLLTAVLIQACSLFGPEEPEEAQEAKELSAPVTDKPESELFESAKGNFRSGMFSAAQDSFDKLRNSYPLGAYAEFAEIKSADARFETGEFDLAAPLYEEFVKNRPASPAVPYMLLKAARSHQLSHRGVGRDPSALAKAEELLTRLIRQYPSSLYTPAARVYLEETRQWIAAHERLVIDFYRRRNKDSAIESREREYEAKFPTVVSESERADEVIVLPLPVAERSELQRIAREAAAQQQLKPEIPEVTPQEAAAAPQAPRSNAVQQVTCDRDKALIFIYLEHPVDAQSLPGASKLPLDGSGLSVTLPGVTTGAEGMKADCFGNADLSISPEGGLSLATSASEARIMSLSKPPRILIIVK